MRNAVYLVLLEKETCDRTNTPYYDLRTDEKTVEMALKMATREMSVLGIAETIEIVVLNDVETPKVEMDELWTG